MQAKVRSNVINSFANRVKKFFRLCLFSVTVGIKQKVEVKTCFADNGDFVDYLPATDEIVVIKLDKEYAVLSCEKETDGSYTVTIGTDIVYTVVIDGEKATITRKK